MTVVLLLENTLYDAAVFVGLFILMVCQQVSSSGTRMPKSSHITPVLKSLHWLKINECIKYKLLSLTYKVLTQTILNISTT